MEPNSNPKWFLHLFLTLQPQSELIKEKVKGLVEYILYPKEGHGFEKIANQKDLIFQADKFLTKFVLYDRDKSIKL